MYIETNIYITFLILWTRKEKSHDAYKAKFQAIFRITKYKKTPEISHVINNTIPLPWKPMRNFAIHKTHHSFPVHAEFYTMLLPAEQFLELPTYSQGRLQSGMPRK